MVNKTPVYFHLIAESPVFSKKTAVALSYIID